MASSYAKCLGLCAALLLAHCGSDDQSKSDSDSADTTGISERDASTRVDASARDASTLDATHGNGGTTHTDASSSGTDAQASGTGADARTQDAQTPSGPSDGGNFPPPSNGQTQKVANPPTYLGATSSSNACTAELHTIGYEPTASGKHPLFLYFVGTQILSADVTSNYDCKAGAAVTEAMARRGFVGLSVQYQNGLDGIVVDKMPCLFDGTRMDGLLAKACALPNVDCGLGIATWGHSQGALLAHTAANYDTRVRAVWTTGYSGLTGAKLSYDRFRVVNGEADTTNADNATINKTANFTGSAVCASGDQCLRSDGSGWMIVRKTQCQLSAADHCWFDKKSCADNDETLEPNWVNADSTQPFALEANADWVAQTLARP